jgi:hypothetical protein
VAEKSRFSSVLAAAKVGRMKMKQTFLRLPCDARRLYAK